MGFLVQDAGMAKDVWVAPVRDVVRYLRVQAATRAALEVATSSTDAEAAAAGALPRCVDVRSAVIEQDLGAAVRLPTVLPSVVLRFSCKTDESKRDELDVHAKLFDAEGNELQDVQAALKFSGD